MKSILETLFEMFTRLTITLSVMIVFGERSSEKVLWICYIALIIWALIIPIKEIVCSRSANNKSEDQDE